MAKTMDELLSGSTSVDLLKDGQIITAKVIDMRGKRLSLDLGPYGLGVVPRRELGFGKTFELGDEVEAMVMDAEGDNGQVTMSIRRAHRDKGWAVVEEALKDGSIIEVVPVDCNKGGLLIDFDGAKGFLPVSQLSQENYPKLSGSQDKSAIADSIKSLVGKPMKVKVIALDRDDNKLIFSEREANQKDSGERLKDFKLGDTIKAKITGIVEYGAFVEAGGVEGMVHISELSWKRVASPEDVVKTGEELELKIISLDNNRLGLSLKQMSKDPWEDEVSKLAVGDKVKAKVTRITPFGAFVQVTPSVEALVHISEVGDGEGSEPEQVFKLGEEQQFEILDINNESRRMFLGIPGSKKSKENAKSPKKDEAKEDKVETE
ncbi:MAG: small subunit ribosomal protein [Patescibacteria group bacterium]|nr:small subunit ribosomal protein [Patescibacteria group bacterium]